RSTVREPRRRHCRRGAGGLGLWRCRRRRVRRRTRWACGGHLRPHRQDTRAEGKYTESAVDAKLFEQVYLDYTTEYLKGPMYAHREKAQGARPDYPGNPLYKNGKMTSNVTGNLKTFSSNELMYLSMLFFGIGLYGNLQFLYFDPQFPRVDSGLNFNVSYIVESHFSCRCPSSSTSRATFRGRTASEPRSVLLTCLLMPLSIHP
ncbi:unnamed protein product, partial [Prorocentrum cordatum]